MFRIYVNVIILFCTRSLRYSTDVPWPNCGLTVPPKVVLPDIVSDCASHSLPSGVETVGVVTLRAAAKDSPVVDDMDPVATDKGVFVEELLEFDLPKEERRFWAEDFLRMVGRVGWSTANWDIAS
jgi:hypothetical protein